MATDHRPFEELSTSGLLWLINAAVFHPRGYALVVSVNADGTAVGWKLLGDGSEPWYFVNDMDAKFAAAEQTLREASPNAPAVRAGEPVKGWARCPRNESPPPPPPRST